MTKNLKKGKNIKIVTLGCPKNIVDSEVLARQLGTNKFNVTFESANNSEDDLSNTKYVIINTCGFINDAKQESIENILRYLDAKKNGEIEKVYVTGCLSQRYKSDLIKELPEVDGFFGTEAYNEIIGELNGTYDHKLLTDRILITPSHYAYLKISEGCNQKCSFCAIPLIRGAYVSKPMKRIVDEAKLLAEKGVKELIIIAEDSTYYGLDLYGKRRIAELIEKISEVDGIEWIRLQYAFPNKFPTDLLKVINENPKVCKYLDIPFQHISDDILKSMKRGISKMDTLKLIDKIRTQVPGIAIRTSIIVGYPLETAEHFEELKAFVETARFDRLGVFTYSHEENTVSFKLKNNISPKTKKLRANILMKLQQSISLELNKAKIGSTLKVLIDRIEGKNFIGRTQADSPEIDNEVIIPSTNKKLQIGRFYNVKITSATHYDLKGIAI